MHAAPFLAGVRNGKRMCELLDSHPQMVAKYPKLMGTILSSMFNSKPSVRHVIVLIGPPGCGKTYAVRQFFDDLFTIPVSTGKLWMDGYEGQSVALIDDFDPSLINYFQMLRLLHPYEERIEVKGSFIVWKPRLIVICSNMSPHEWFDSYWRNNNTTMTPYFRCEDDRMKEAALSRRIYHIYSFFDEQVTRHAVGSVMADKWVLVSQETIIPKLGNIWSECDGSGAE